MKKWFWNLGRQAKEEVGFFQVFIFLLSLYVILALVGDALFDFDPEVKRLLQQIDNGVCVIFLGDFLWRFFKAANKWEFMRWGWIDLISSIPAWNGLLLGRSVRLLRILRLIRAFRSFHSLRTHLFKDFRRGVLGSVGIGVVFLVLFCSVGVLSFERDTPGANIHNGNDALWWAMTTVTTVGYGDKVPVSPEGRMIAIVLMVGGVAMFSTLTALIASQFVQKTDGDPLRRIEAKLDAVQRELDEMRRARAGELD